MNLYLLLKGEVFLISYLF